MVILTTVYNAEEYIEQCIGSIIGQSHSEFICYITDDVSTDKTVDKIKLMIKGDNRFILIENKEKLYQPGNYDQVIRYNPNILGDDVCFEIDGDDWLPNSKTLEFLNNVYQDKNVWITNGSFRYSDGSMGFSTKQKITNTLRQDRMTCSHMRTWRAFLWRAIKEDDLKDENGVYWKVTGDLAFMFPMLEMAGEEHYKFIEDILYIYNGENPLNDHKVNLSLVNEIANKIRNKTPYTKLIM